ncbi:branched-chain amino acid ABC transporter permease [Ilumatobacter coccineus]|uniref:Putative amino acid ABC transporter permease protein n=1 Tax=Ilumatobacter coccineus (strain NBRC 103263 / KCTC 29153 / YM16-304) TaxID=1313172 RepID=A0A6C7E6R0_ILUCY|nr:branched-chain amino acid ABC transporter permease [Ilumatobacter coccineus]BAN00929.1 putative amino acid ABC transporter permease protein [Ilumatobacter coccineus YM16-304]
MANDYDVELRIFSTPFLRGGAILLMAFAAWAMFWLGDYWLSVANFAAIAAIAVIGLNVVSGDAGQISLGHAVFVGAGAYTAGWLGTDHGWPFPAVVIAGGVIAAAFSLLVGPLALRLRGLYLAFSTLALVFVGQHLLLNLDGITGGGAGRAISSPSLFGTKMSEDATWLGIDLTSDQKWFVVLAASVAVIALAIRNLQRTRIGRAFNSVRDQDIAASTIGIHVSRVKTQAFVLSAFIGGMAGAFYGSYIRFVNPATFGLLLAVQYLAMAVVGGLGSVSGGILGALFITAIPRVIDEWGHGLPFVTTDLASQRGLTPELLSSVIYGAVVIGFLIFEPAGITGIWRRVKAYLRSWPFRY